jgi:HAMP domain-containing protein
MANNAKAQMPSWFPTRLHVKSIRGQLTLGLAAALVPCLAIGFFTTQQFVRSKVTNLTEKRLSAEAELISYGLRQWGLGTSNAVELLAISPAFMRGNISEVQEIFKSLSLENPYRLWRFWDSSKMPKLLAYSGLVSTEYIKAAESNQFSRDYHQAALRGYSSYQVVNSKTSGVTCLNVAQPVFTRPPTRHQKMNEIGALKKKIDFLAIPIRPDVTGVIVLCVPLSRLGNDTGLIELFRDQRLTNLSNDNKRDFLNDKNGFESAVILISNSGQLLFPDADWGSNHIPQIEELSKSTIPALKSVAMRAQDGEESFTRVQADRGRTYLALTSKVDSAWSLILLLNERKATADVAAIGQVQALVALLTVFFVLVIIAYRSNSLSQPLSKAGDALKKISTGNFDVKLPPTTNDEIGGLLSNVQITADRLKCYLSEVTSFAVTQKQLDTAKSIQQDFLLPSLPSSPSYDVEAFSRSALEIGADWYDMVDAGDFAYFVVADVCDKGVPSALYMSVFRSLIRSKILARYVDPGASPDASSVILDAIEETNNYMASNQNSSMMFATVFIAAINKATGSMSYICAGHESPVFVSSRDISLLDSVSGPAIGLFEGASYSVFHEKLQPGDGLVVYSDGLIDARDPNNVGWGIGRLRDLLTVTRVNTSSQLMASIVSRVDEHMAGADQFDDLTVLVFRWLGS